MAGGLVWTIAQTGRLYGLDPATGKIRQQTAIGTPADHFPTPGIGAGLLLAPSARNVIAFRTSAATATPSAARHNRPDASPGLATTGSMIAEVVLPCMVAVSASGWLIWLIGKKRRT